MKFGEFSGTDLISKVNDTGASCFYMPGTVFFRIFPELSPNDSNEKMKLKAEYKPEATMPGLHSVQLKHFQENLPMMQQAKDKIKEHERGGMNYQNPSASLKLHISINNIGELDEETLLGLIELLNNEAESPDTDLNFDYKIIGPDMAENERFKTNDQITIYFDKYSSTAAIARLAGKVDEYLKARIPENTQKLGPKDSFGMNSFVSARFDNNKLLEKYHVYPFFDLEIQKFYERYPPEALEKVPLCALESVFTIMLVSTDISLNPNALHEELNEESSKKVQAEFDKMLMDPRKYMEIPEKIENVDEKIMMKVSSLRQIQPNSLNAEKYIACRQAIEERSLYKLNILLEKNPELARQTDGRGWSLLHHSANALFPEAVTRLIDIGADPDAKTKASGSTPLVQAIGVANRKLQTENKLPLEELQLITLLAFQTEDQHSLSQYKAFFESVKQSGLITQKELDDQLFLDTGNKKPVEYLNALIRLGANPHALNDRGWSTLMQAARVNNLGAIDLLIEQGVNLNTQSINEGTTALMLACENAQMYIAVPGRAQAINKLLTAGADINLTNKEGKKAVSFYGASPLPEDSERNKQDFMGLKSRLDPANKFNQVKYTTIKEVDFPGVKMSNIEIKGPGFIKIQAGNPKTPIVVIDKSYAAASKLPGENEQIKTPASIQEFRTALRDELFTKAGRGFFGKKVPEYVAKLLEAPDFPKIQEVLTEIEKTPSQRREPRIQDLYDKLSQAKNIDKAIEAINEVKNDYGPSPGPGRS